MATLTGPTSRGEREVVGGVEAGLMLQQSRVSPMG